MDENSYRFSYKRCFIKSFKVKNLIINFLKKKLIKIILKRAKKRLAFSSYRHNPNNNFFSSLLLFILSSFLGTQIFNL